MNTPLLLIVLAIVAFYLVAGVWRYLRQLLQPDDDRDRRPGGRRRR